MKILVFVFLTTLFFPDTSRATANDQFRYEPSKVVLSGRLTFKKYINQQPPYYGENTTVPKVDVLVLVLDKPIDVLGTPGNGPDGESCYGIKFLEIDNIDDENLSAQSIKRYLSFRVQVSGSLYERQTGFEYTDVLLDVDKISLLKKKRL